MVDDVRFATREARKAHRMELKEELEKTLRERSAVEWDELLADSGVPVAPVLTVEQALALPQITARGLLYEVPMPPLALTAGDSEAGPVGDAAGGERSLRVLGSSVQVDGASVGPSGRPPGLGEHTDEILAELGYSAEEITSLHEGGAI